MLGIKLKEFRLRASLTQVACADHINVTDVQIGRIEKGVRTPTFDQLKVLFILFNASDEEQLELLQIFFETRLPEQLNSCKDSIHELSAKLLTESQLDDYMDNLPNSLGPILRDPIIINMLSLLKLIDPEKRKDIVGDMASLCQLEDDKFKYNMESRCILHKLPYDNLLKAREMLKIFLGDSK